MKDLTGINILLVDDEIEILSILEFLLKRLNANVQTANNGNEAYDIWKKNNHNFHVVVTDVSMPGKNADGITLTSRLRADSSDSVIVVVTGYSKQSEETAYKAGADIVLSKPFDIKIITQFIFDNIEKAKV
jgi:CheY-like chemotaxis protein